MPTIKQTKMCIKHGFYNGSYCLKCKGVLNKHYDVINRDKESAHFYNSRKWRRLRDDAMIRDNLLCVMCLKNGIETLATEVDHIVPIKQDVSLGYDLDNLQSLCHKCHMIKTKEDTIKYS